MQDGIRESYDPITLSSEVYLNKSVAQNTFQVRSRGDPSENTR
jgi:hypothetical protein